MEQLEKAVTALDEALAMEKSEIVRDGTIQRFEFVFEMSWKLMKSWCTYLGETCTSPRDCIRFANHRGWLIDAEYWLLAMDARNMTSQLYNANVAERVYLTAAKFPVEVRNLLHKMNDELR